MELNKPRIKTFINFLKYCHKTSDQFYLKIAKQKCYFISDIFYIGFELTREEYVSDLICVLDFTCVCSLKKYIKAPSLSVTSPDDKNCTIFNFGVAGSMEVPDTRHDINFFEFIDSPADSLVFKFQDFCSINQPDCKIIDGLGGFYIINEETSFITKKLIRGLVEGNITKTPSRSLYFKSLPLENDFYVKLLFFDDNYLFKIKEKGLFFYIKF